MMPIYLPTSRDAAALRASQSKQQNMRGAGMTNTPTGVALAPPRFPIQQRSSSPPQHVLGIITTATGAGGSYTVEAAYLSSASVLTAYVSGDSRHLSVTAQNMAELGSGVANALAVGQAVELFWTYTEDANSVRMWYFYQEAAAADYYTLHREWQCVSDTTPDPVVWQTCGHFVRTDASPRDIGLDVPYAGYVRAIVPTLGNTTGGAPWDIRVYNETTATADGSPEITNLADDNSYSAVGGTLPVAVHDKLRIQIRGAVVGQSTFFSIPVDIILERT